MFNRKGKQRERNFRILATGVILITASILHYGVDKLEKSYKLNNERIRNEIGYIRISEEEKAVRLKYLDGMRDGGFKLQRELWALERAQSQYVISE